MCVPLESQVAQKYKIGKFYSLSKDDECCGKEEVGLLGSTVMLRVSR